jgi:hypothetical protein
LENPVNDTDGALYNLKTDPDEKNIMYLDPEFSFIINDLFNLAEDWTGITNECLR